MSLVMLDGYLCQSCVVFVSSNRVMGLRYTLVFLYWVLEYRIFTFSIRVLELIMSLSGSLMSVPDRILRKNFFLRKSIFLTERNATHRPVNSLVHKKVGCPGWTYHIFLVSGFCSSSCFLIKNKYQFNLSDSWKMLAFLFLPKQLDELQVITGFVQAAKRLKTVCSWVYALAKWMSP